MTGSSTFNLHIDVFSEDNGTIDLAVLKVYKTREIIARYGAESWEFTIMREFLRNLQVVAKTKTIGFVLHK